MKRLLALLAALALLTACAAPAPAPAQGGYALYFAARLEENAGGDAIGVETRRVPDAAAMETEALAETLLTALLAAPEDAALFSPFPSGTRLQKLSVARGRAVVDLSEEYAALSGIDLSIADACATLTLTQLDGIYAVQLTADGRELPQRGTQLFTAADALLSGGEDVLRPVNVMLYFLDTSAGALRAQAETLALYEGQTRAEAVMDALARDPEGDDTLQTLWDESSDMASTHMGDGVCYVNLTSAMPMLSDEQQSVLAIEALARSLLSLDGVDEVQFLIDGVSIPQWTWNAET